MLGRPCMHLKQSRSCLSSREDLVCSQQLESTFIYHFGLWQNVLKICFVPCIPYRPSCSGPLFHFLPCQFCLHQTEELEKISHIVAALLHSSSRQGPCTAGKGALPKQVSCRFRVLAAELAATIRIHSFPRKVISSRQYIGHSPPRKVSDLGGNLEIS